MPKRSKPPSGTTSPGFPDGHSPSDSPAGPQTDPCGRDRARASRTRRQGKVSATKTRATCGPNSDASSPSGVLQQFLASRLRARLGDTGSPEFAVIWSSWDMPLGVPISRLRVSVRRISETACTGVPPDCWPTPKAQEDGRTLDQYEAARQKGYKARKGKTSGGPASAKGGLAIAAQLTEPPAGWPTAGAGDADRGVDMERRDNGRPNSNLNTIADLAGWATPNTRDWKAEIPPEQWEREGQGQPLSRQVLTATAGWTTPSATDGDRGGTGITEGMSGSSLGQQSQLAGWMTPMACNGRGSGGNVRGDGKPKTELTNQAQLAGWPTPQAGTPATEGRPQTGNTDASRITEHLASGPDTISSTAETGRPAASRGQLNPVFSCFLQGFPISWVTAGQTASASLSRKGRSKGG